MFGQLEILVDLSTDFAKGTGGIRTMQSIDIAVAVDHVESFAVIQDAIVYPGSLPASAAYWDRAATHTIIRFSSM